MGKTYVIVTCRAGNEEWCEEEIGNVLFLYNHGVRINRTRYKGVLLVETSLNPDRVYRIVSSREYGFVEKIIPLHVVVNKIDIRNIVESIRRLVIEKGVKDSIRLHIVFRGIRGFSNILWKEVTRSLRELGISVSKKSSTCLYIESIDNFIGISLIEC